MRVVLEFGARARPLSEQLGLTGERGELLDRIQAAIVLLDRHNIIAPVIRERAHDRLALMISEAFTPRTDEK